MCDTPENTVGFYATPAPVTFELKAKIDDLKSYVNTLEQANSALQTDNKKLHTGVTDLQTINRYVLNINNTLFEENEKLKQNLNETKQSLNIIDYDNKSLSKACSEIAIELGSAQATVKKVTDCYDNLFAKYQKLIQEQSTELYKVTPSTTPLFELPPDTCLTKAHDIVEGDREQVYGAPDLNLTRIAEFWTTYVNARQVAIYDGFNINDVCAMMRLVKEARLINTPNHADSLVDICGYARLQEKCNEKVQSAATNKEPTKGGDTSSKDKSSY